MTATYQMDVDELILELISSIKSVFKNKTINITVTEAFDETEYLLSSPANKAHLEKSIKDIVDGKGIIMSVEELYKKFS